MSVVEAGREVRAERAPAAPIDADARDKCSVSRISLPFFEAADCALAASKIPRRLGLACFGKSSFIAHSVQWHGENRLLVGLSPY